MRSYRRNLFDFLKFEGHFSTCTSTQDAHFCQRGSRVTGCRHETGQGDTAGALDVVVEYAVDVTVLLQQRDGLGGLEILKLTTATSTNQKQYSQVNPSQHHTCSQ